MFYREGLGLDLVEIVRMNIESEIGKEASEKFLNDPTVKYSIGKAEPFQRVAINKFFNAELIKFRATHNVDINDVIFLLVNDGDAHEWIKIIKNITIPFCRDHKVL